MTSGSTTGGYGGQGGGEGGAQTAPKAGDIVEGYKFKGGDPSDQSNWEKQ